MLIDQSIDNTWISQKRPVMENDVLIQTVPVPEGVWNPGDDSLKQHDEKSLPVTGERVVCRIVLTQRICPVLAWGQLTVNHPSTESGKPTMLCVL